MMGTAPGNTRTAAPRTMQLDHLFVLTTVGAPAGERLLDLGLHEGAGNVHPGQGTANRRFYLANAMLELLWVHDPAQADAGPGRDLGLVRRAGEPGACPFGLIFAGGDAPPFPGWHYHPAYLPPQRYFLVGGNSRDLAEPLCIHVPFADPGAGARDPDRDETLTGVDVGLPPGRRSAVLERVARVPGLAVVAGHEHLLTLSVRGGNVRGGDLRPDLPLVVHAHP